MKRYIRTIAILLVAVSTMCTLCTCAVGDTIDQQLLMSTRSIIRQSNIYIETALYERSPLGMFNFCMSRGLGSGAVFLELDNYYYAITNWHVIEYEGYDSAVYTITNFYGEKTTGQVVKQDKDKDLAVIKFAKVEQQLTIIDYTTRLDKPLIVGELLLAVGNPSGVQNNVTFGEYMGLAKISNVDYNVVYHSALISSGNSGGALCDINGSLVGINTWSTADSDERNYSIPLSIIYDFIKSFIA
ncbi:MAG: trypsin-like peptidase domain-containing protein [Clostridia bacterium]|nr:trypsin-like peptidase domain-containing protein [Clostridia bacterium]MDD3832097.1 trypsin-like peptidase domain-containing protein [Clostridia bacterium]